MTIHGPTECVECKKFSIPTEGMTKRCSKCAAIICFGHYGSHYEKCDGPFHRVKNNPKKRHRFSAYCPSCGKGTDEGKSTGRYARFYGEGPPQIRYECKKCRHVWHSFEGAVEC